MTDTAEQIPENFRASVGRALEACADLAPGPAAARLADDGLLGVLADPAVGGLGLPLAFALPVAEAAGTGLCRFPLTEAVLAAQALQDSNPDAARAIVEGREIAVIAWRGAVGAATLGPMVWAEGARWLLANDGANGFTLVDLHGTDHEPRTPVTLETDRTMVLLDLPAGMRGTALSRAEAAGLRSGGILLRAAEMLGCAEAAFAQARQHVETRRQFGRPLSAFQGIRHEMARHALALAGMRRTVEGAACGAGTPAGDLTTHAALAVAAEKAPAIAEAAIQLNGAMGFTWDVPLHRYLRRLRSLGDVMDAPGARAWLAEGLIAGWLPLDPDPAEAAKQRDIICRAEEKA